MANYTQLCIVKSMPDLGSERLRIHYYSLSQLLLESEIFKIIMKSAALLPSSFVVSLTCAAE
jgi:hypothetical protein